MTKMHVVVLVLGLSWSVSGAQQHVGAIAPYKPVTQFDPARDASRDIDNAVLEARRTGKRVLLDVGGDWCVWCRRLDSLFRRRADLEEYMGANYVVVKINYSDQNRNEKVLSRYPKVAGYPHLFVLDSDGTLLHSQNTGELEAGKGHDPGKVMAFLKKWAPAAARQD